jgi:formylglycine-generating enzyme required for sulfatase activity
MVLIPAGEFWMGSPDGEGDKDEHPRHQVYLDAFYMDKFEVTVARYAEFMRSTNRSKPAYWDRVDINKHGNLPVIGVDWHDAEDYCRWAGKRLPTEAEWERAARGTDGRTYPWGNEGPTPRLANFGKDYTNVNNVYDESLAPVESFEAGNSPYGLHRMAGNVWEWTADWYDEHYYKKSPPQNPKGPSSDTGKKVLRGGSWTNVPGNVRSADRNRYTPTTRYSHLGFRCAQDSPK